MCFWKAIGFVRASFANEMRILGAPAIAIVAVCYTILFHCFSNWSVCFGKIYICVCLG